MVQFLGMMIAVHVFVHVQFIGLLSKVIGTHYFPSLGLVIAGLSDNRSGTRSVRSAETKG